MQLKCRIVKDIMSVCLVEINYVFPLSLHGDPLRHRAGFQTTPGRFAPIYRPNNIDQNQFSGIFIIQCWALMSILIKKCKKNYWIYGRKSSFLLHPLSRCHILLLLNQQIIANDLRPQDIKYQLVIKIVSEGWWFIVRVEVE